MPAASSDSPYALVTGASGFIGRHLVARLLASGWRVAVLTRRPGRAFPEGVRVHVGDLSTGDGLSIALFDDVQVLFHCAGEVEHAGAMRGVHVEGTRRLLGCLAERPVWRPLHWVQLSSVGAYGPPARGERNRCVTEETPEHPVGEYEMTKTEADRLVREAAPVAGFSYTILRPSNVVGPGMPNASMRGLISMIRRRLYFHIGAPGAVATYVHVDDVVSALVACAVRPESAGQVFNLSSDCPLDAVVHQIARSAGVRPPRLRVPETVVRAVVRAAGRLLALPLTSARIDALVNRTRYPSDRIEDALGFRFARPMPAGIADLVEADGAVSRES